MKISLRAAAFPLIALALCPWGSALAQKIYKWTDADGQVHYSQLPPTGVESEAVKGPAKVDSDAALEALRARSKAFDERRTESAKAADKAGTDAASADERKARCDGIRTQIERFQNAQRVYETDASGQRVRLDPETRTARLAALQTDLDKSCK